VTPVDPVILVHGGAGNPAPERVHDETPFHEALAAAVQAAIGALGDGALAAAVAAVEHLEDHPRFNAGRGSVPTSDGTVEMDAAAMDGRSGRAGAVAAVRTTRHPVALARAVMDHSAYAMMVGEGADRFAAEQGLDQAEPSWFGTPGEADAIGPGTVGAVVLDRDGALAAATSTGGRRGQPPGRVGDSPLIGAGTFADGRRAISMTGDGEAIIPKLSAHVIALSPAPLAEACDDAVAALGGAPVGLIALDAGGDFAMPFNTGVMHRGWWRAGAPVQTRVHL
jgi:beta-aspartyl-peptidase (threonine type)